jgi:hypothetical protein
MREVQAKWDRLSMSDLAQIKTKADLIARVQEQYGLDREVAAQDVEIWNSDRHFWSIRLAARHRGERPSCTGSCADIMKE